MDDVTNILKRKEDLLRQIDSWKSKLAVATAEKERLEEDIKRHLATLQEKFDVTSLAEAEELLKAKIARAEELCDVMETALNDLRS